MSAPDPPGGVGGSHRCRTVLGAVAAGLAGAAYWTLMSPYAQTLGAFPYRATGRVTGDNTVALTFDDGPNEPYTSQIAALLAERAIPATFFQVGRCVQRHPDVTRALVLAGHVIGNHSYTHSFSRCWTRPRLEDELQRAQGVFGEVLNAQPALYRPPWLARTPALFDLLAEHSLQPVSGEFCHALEVMQPSPHSIARRALAKVRPGSIIIFHDGYDAQGGDRACTVAAVRIVADRLLALGYRFDTVDRLLGLPAYSN